MVKKISFKWKHLELSVIFERELTKLATEKDKIIAEKEVELVIKNRELEDDRQKADNLLKQIEELKRQMKK